MSAGAAACTCYSMGTSASPPRHPSPRRRRRTWCSTRRRRRASAAWSSASPATHRRRRRAYLRRRSTWLTCTPGIAWCVTLAVRRLNVDGVGRLLTDGWFGGASWSPCGRFLTVVAEPKAAPSASHFAASAKGEADKEATRGGGWALREDWGEKYTGVTEPALFVLDTHGEAGGLLRLPLPDGVACVGQPTFRPGGDGGFDDLHVAFTGWLPQPRKLGMIYCYQRPCQIFEASIGGAVARWVGGTEEEGATAEVPVAAVTPALRLARSPRWHPSGDRLAFLGSAEGFETHNGPVFLGIAERGGRP
mmetsp:Transcript_21890/g.67174  ORF Transcript_21890/g.67174 Transcript_21890/m.67174 type:complete len:305 (-) Transcript_21890:1624-2538(-)